MFSQKPFSSEPLQALGIACFQKPYSQIIVTVPLTIRSLLDEVREVPSFLLRNNDDPLVNSIQIFLIFFFSTPLSTPVKSSYRTCDECC